MGKVLKFTGAYRSPDPVPVEGEGLALDTRTPATLWGQISELLGWARK